MNYWYKSSCKPVNGTDAVIQVLSVSSPLSCHANNNENLTIKINMYKGSRPLGIGEIDDPLVSPGKAYKVLTDYFYGLVVNHSECLCGPGKAVQVKASMHIRLCWFTWVVISSIKNKPEIL